MMQNDCEFWEYSEGRARALLIDKEDNGIMMQGSQSGVCHHLLCIGGIRQP